MQKKLSGAVSHLRAGAKQAVRMRSAGDEDVRGHFRRSRFASRFWPWKDKIFHEHRDSLVQMLITARILIRYVHLLEIMEDRYDRKSTIITTLLPIEGWHDYIGDHTLADAICDQVLTAGYKIEITGASVRKNNDCLTHVDQ